MAQREIWHSQNLRIGACLWVADREIRGTAGAPGQAWQELYSRVCEQASFHFSLGQPPNLRVEAQLPVQTRILRRYLTMGARQQKSTRDRLPNLPPDARARIQTGELHARERLIQDMRAAMHDFIEATAKLPKVRNSRVAEYELSIKRFQRAFRDAKIRAQQALFDLAAAEYLRVDGDPEAYSERLMQVIVPYAREGLLIRHDDRIISATVLARVTEWETQRTGEEEAKGQHPTTSVRETPANLIDRLRRRKQWTIEDLAEQSGVNIKQIYSIKAGKPVTSVTIAKIASALECGPGPFILMTTLKSER